MKHDFQFRLLAALWLMLAWVGSIFAIVDLVRTAGDSEGVTPSGLVAIFSLAAIAAAASLGILLHKNWGRSLGIALSAIVLIGLGSAIIATLAKIGWDVGVAVTVLMVATLLVSVWSLWLLRPGKGRESFEAYVSRS